MMVSKALDMSSDTADQPTKLRILQGCGSPLVQSLSQSLSAAIEAKGIQCTSEAWKNLNIREADAAYLVLDNAHLPILLDPSLEVFESIKLLLTTCRYLLWISFQGDDHVQATSMKALVTGVARVMRRENEGVRFITLDIQQSLIGDLSNVVTAITKVADACFWPKCQADCSSEFEYTYSDSKLLVPRVHADTQFNDWIDRANGQTRLETCPYQQAHRPLKLEVESPGLLSSLRFVHDSTPSLPLGSDEIQLEARAYGVNFRDVFIALGQMLPGLPMVGEVAGIVTAVGSDMHSKYKVGDRVMGIGAQPFASHPRVKGLRARVLPDSISFTAAASIPIVFLTAYHCLVEVAHLEKGQTVLIQAASGGVGQAAIQIAQHIGAEIVATVGSAGKRKLIMDRYDIPESHIFSSRMRTFKQGVLRLTKNRGVDVVLNSLAGEMLNESWECVAHLGTFIEIGKADIYKRSHLSMVPFDKSTTFAAIDLLALFDRQPRRMYDSLGKVVEMFEKGFVFPVDPLMPMSIDKIEAAFRLIATRKHIGKVIVEADSDTKVKAALPAPAPLVLHPNGTYIIAGGLGDLGMRLCRFLARHGAQHIVTLSRRTLDKEFREEFERDVAQLGGTLHIVKCDITDKTSVSNAAAICQTSLPPVKGIIHAGMVLRVSAAQPNCI
jgi:NADPH:quinone reductase-like Zn-dependent oxidoreductase